MCVARRDDAIDRKGRVCGKERWSHTGEGVCVCVCVCVCGKERWSHTREGSRVWQGEVEPHKGRCMWQEEMEPHK